MSVLINMAVKLIGWIFFLVLNFAIYFLFGLLITAPAGRPCRKGAGRVGDAGDLPSSPESATAESGRSQEADKAGEKSAGLILVSGFFLYYSLFTLFAVPVMYRWRPLSLLAALWAPAVIIICVVSLLLNRKRMVRILSGLISSAASHRLIAAAAVLLVFIEIIVVLYSYQFTLDAAYYVANVTTSVQTDSLNIYNPYTGDWQDHFEMRYFFATYALQDAVMCRWFNIPALIQTKIIMATIVIILTNMLYFMIAKELTEGMNGKGSVETDSLSGKGGGRSEVLIPVIAMFFAGLINFFFTTIYTSSAFLLTRTYEGKSILANIILPGILYIYIRMIKSGRPMFALLFVLSFGSTVISNTSNMLVPAALMVLFVPHVFILLFKGEKRQAAKAALGTLLCMLPGMILSIVYVAYVKGMFVFYTYPR